MNRNKRANIAQETLEIIERGSYINSKGENVELAQDIKKAVDSSVHYDELALNNLSDKVTDVLANCDQGKFLGYLVENCTTFEGAQTLLKQFNDVLCLNFASAKNPGGGFLGGSQAQEEALARASALYPCLTKHMDMYLKNREENKVLYSHDMIYSKDVPVFRNEAGELFDKPYTVSFITSAAVNAGVALRKEPGCEFKIRREMKDRARHVLSVAIENGHELIVLGAWGCGVFRNRPEVVASIFYELMEYEGFKYAFRKVGFSVLDLTKSLEIYNVFSRKFCDKK
ncbi:TIGR02452 family protein [Aliikangiella coralliicola]|uniref:TIGR02452 family protein n=1 Tax=Aliikangiella coralliicola TaxID=2592383 RepID=A0A545UES7_9GAMM|nr:TIGR02452 family protein [Aliikangiella coralliicola]TQV87981.1 TIGR02452 family protein [Aliikangiella coralliicola]